MTYEEVRAIEKKYDVEMCLCPVCGNWTYVYNICETCGYESSGYGFDDDLEFEDIDHNFTLGEYRKWYEEGTLREHIYEVQPNWRYLIEEGRIPDKPGNAVDFPLVYPKGFATRFLED